MKPSSIRILSAMLGTPLLMLAACSPGQDDNQSNEENFSAPILNNLVEPPVANEGAIANEAAATDEAAQDKNSIPLGLRGRWGLVSADCTSNMGDNKGLLEIDAKTLEFYESSATLRSIIQWSTQRLHANFDFTGEGMSWKREMELDLQEGGQVLVRRDHGEDAQPGPLRYRRCTS